MSIRNFTVITLRYLSPIRAHLLGFIAGSPCIVVIKNSGYLTCFHIDRLFEKQEETGAREQDEFDHVHTFPSEVRGHIIFFISWTSIKK